MAVAGAARPSPTVLDRAVRWIDAAEPVDVVLRFSVIALVAASHYEPLLMAATAIAAVVLLAQRRLLHHPAPWLVGGSALGLWQAVQWYRFDNHVWLTTYWVLAVGLSLTTADRRRTLAANGRLMVGLIFALAAAWKLGSADFRSGDFFHYSLLRDDRFGFVAELFGGLSDDTRAADHQAVQGLARHPSEWVTLHSTAAVRRVATVFTVWGAVIEAAIAVLWLVPVRRFRWVRHGALLAFVGTTYLVVPVGGFGCLLMAMGMTQDPDLTWVRRAYAAAFGLLLLYGPVWQAVFAP